MNQEDSIQADSVVEAVKARYAEAARSALRSDGGPCQAEEAEPGCCCCDADAVTGGLYTDEEASEVPRGALSASLGCGNPTALARLEEGETVLDLGSGGGIDVLLSARRVGPTGFAYGLDMTGEMLELAERNRRESGVENAAFLEGRMEDIPLPDASVDVVLSNCVINLSVDKEKVLREAFRVLKPGGRLAVSDVVVEGELPAEVRRDIESFVGCIAGALERGDYARKLSQAGFEDVEIQPTRVYGPAGCCGGQAEGGGRVMAAFIRAVKPGAPA